jgi:hypothetical protein
MEVLQETPNNNSKQEITSKPTPIGFVIQEMSGISDTYAYTTVDQVPRHTYSTYNEIDNKIYTAPKDEGKITINNKNSHLSFIKRKREEQDELINDIFKKQVDNIHILNAKRQETEKTIQNIVNKQQENIFDLYDK